MLRAVLYDPANGQLRDGGAELIDEWDQSAQSTIWVALKEEPAESEGLCSS